MNRTYFAGVFVVGGGGLLLVVVFLGGCLFFVYFRPTNIGKPKKISDLRSAHTIRITMMKLLKS